MNLLPILVSLFVWCSRYAKKSVLLGPITRTSRVRPTGCCWTRSSKPASLGRKDFDWSNVPPSIRYDRLVEGVEYNIFVHELYGANSLKLRAASASFFAVHIVPDLRGEGLINQLIPPSGTSWFIKREEQAPNQSREKGYFSAYKPRNYWWRTIRKIPPKKLVSPST